MEIEKIIENFEKLIYSILVLIILIPKTVYRLITNSSFSYEYIIEQFNLEEENRFKNYVSPIILLISTVAPNLFMAGFKNEVWELSPFFNSFKALTTNERILLFTVYFSLIPLLISAFILLRQKKIVNSINLKRPLYSLIYIFTSNYLSIYLLFFIFIFKSLLEHFEIIVTIILLSFLFCTINFCRSLSYFFKKELLISSSSSNWLAFIVYAVVYLISIWISYY